MPAGIFGLKKTYKKQVLDAWPELAEFGYYGGGFSPSIAGNIIDRLDFSNETTSLPGNNLTVDRRYLAAVSNSNYGYFAGGQVPPTVCTIDRLDFSNETVAAPGISPGQLTQPRRWLAAVSNSNYGYFAGGGTPSQVCTIDRLDFSNETTSAPGNNLPQAREYLKGVSNSNYGYFGGGFKPGPTVLSTIDRLDFSNETTSNPPVNLTQVRFNLAAVSNSNYGYFAGGNDPSKSPTSTSTIDRLDFSNESILILDDGVTGIFQSRTGHTGVSNSNYGYFVGDTFSPNTNLCRLDFSNETTNIPPSRSPQGTRSSMGAVSTKPTTETVRKVRRGLVDVSENPISKAYGYFAGGGNTPNPPQVCTIDRLDFSNETVSAPGNGLPQARIDLAAVSNSNYGYFGGGYDFPNETSTIDRLDFSSETVAAPGAYQLTQARFSLAAVSNSNYGYFGGGDAPGFVSTIDRLDFSNETVDVPGTLKQLTQARANLAAVSNSNYGYFAGGGPLNYSTIDRLDFSNETVDGPATLPPQCQLTQARFSLAAVSNSNYGYFGGGFSPGNPGWRCTIDRLDFSNETVDGPATLPPQCQLTLARNQLAAVSNSNYGYFGGGYVPIFCTIDRLDFSNETVDVPGTLEQLTQRRRGLAAVSN